MAHYGGPTPKRHIGWSNSRAIGLLDLGTLRGFNYKASDYQDSKCATTTTKRDGKKAFTGNIKQLKNSQTLVGNQHVLFCVRCDVHVNTKTYIFRGESSRSHYYFVYMLNCCFFDQTKLYIH